MRIDLWQQPLASGSDAVEDEELRVAVPLAAATRGGTVRQRSRMLPGTVRALRIPPGRSIRFRLTAGAESFLSFRPLLPGTAACPTVYRVRGRPADGRWRLLGERRPEPGRWEAPATASVDLTSLAAGGVELELAAATPGARCRRRHGLSLWGSPAVYVRRPPAAGQRRRPPPEHPDVILLTFDALRADALGAYGRSPSLTPALDALASESDVWLDAFACFNGTNPSLASLMTGLYGKHHGVYDLHTPLPGRHRTLAELLRRQGYATGAVVAVNHLRPRKSGLDQGFDAFHVAPRMYSAELATDLALEWLADQRRPYFLWLHVFDPHTPHTPPRPFAQGRVADGTWGLRPVGSWLQVGDPGPIAYRKPLLGAHEALYAAEVAYLDRQVDRLLGYLRAAGALRRTLLVVSSDHGENLLEHGFHFRHGGLWDATTRVPLLIRWPGPPRPGRRLSGFAQSVDVFPTVLAAAGLTPPPSDGRDLGAWSADPSAGRRRIWAEHMNGYGTMVRDRRYLYMRIDGHPHLAAGGYLYDLRRDPAQEHNLATRRPRLAAAFDRLLDGWLADRVEPPPSRRDLEAVERERLRALGYLDDG